MDEKNMQFANFNITFGQNDAPMLEHFADVIFPAFTSGYIRGKESDGPKYSFDNVQIKEIDDEYVLVGNYIKSTEYKVVTTVQEGILVSSPADVPTAPYSRFIVFLKNHRSESVMKYISDREHLTDYYKGRQATKVSDQKIRTNDKDGILGDLASRIYDIRCRIVHNKASESYKKILPLSPEESYLSHDIELLQFLARKAIVANSRPINLP